jgi:hypothetical protein
MGLQPCMTCDGRRAQVVYHELVDRKVGVPLLEAHRDLGVSRGQPRLHVHNVHVHVHVHVHAHVHTDGWTILPPA